MALDLSKKEKDTARDNRDRRNAGEDIAIQNGSFDGTLVKDAIVVGETAKALDETDERVAALAETVDALTKKLLEIQAQLSKKPAHGVPGTYGPVSEDEQQTAYKSRFVTHGPTPFSKKVQIYIMHQENDQNLPVHVSINGFTWSLPRGATISVPTEVVEVLEHAEVDGWQPTVTAEGATKLERVRYQRHPFSMLN